ncbi:TPA: fimbrial protein [Enterobacter cancerogenus]|nr:type 1 fimbrial protein [Enterobacter chengduensis]
MRKKLLYVMLTGAALVSAGNVFADGSATIHFTGSVATTACSVQINNVKGDTSLNMGSIDMASLNVGDSSKPYDFEIELTGCPSSMKNAEATFIGNPSPDERYFSVNGSNSQSLGLAIIDEGSSGAAKNYVKPNVQDNFGFILDDTGTFKESFSAQLVKLQESVDESSFDISTAIDIVYL